MRLTLIDLPATSIEPVPFHIQAFATLLRLAPHIASSLCSLLCQWADFFLFRRKPCNLRIHFSFDQVHQLFAPACAANEQVIDPYLSCRTGVYQFFDYTLAFTTQSVQSAFQKQCFCHFQRPQSFLSIPLPASQECRPFKTSDSARALSRYCSLSVLTQSLWARFGDIRFLHPSQTSHL